MPPITVVVADREKARRAACLRLLRPEKRIRIVGEARSALETIAAATLQPRILVLDLRFTAGTGLGLLRIVRQKSPGTRVILVSRRASPARILDALSHGAFGSLDEHLLHRFLPKAVRLVDAGEAWVPRKLVARILERLADLAA